VSALACAAAPAAADVLTFSNPGAISIPGVGTGTPYPSEIAVAGVTDLVAQITVTVTGFSHSFPDDVGALLVGPTGAAAVLFNGPGSGSAVTGLTWTFDDAAASALPTTGALVSGTFRPSNGYPTDNFLAPAPAGPYANALSGFAGLDPNGSWSLYVVDFAAGDTGSISGGWSVSLTTAPIPEPATWALWFAGMGLMGAMVRRRSGSPAVQG
jgi:subtilisin-like proprotein convertase family protein